MQIKCIALCKLCEVWACCICNYVKLTYKCHENNIIQFNRTTFHTTSIYYARSKRRTFHVSNLMQMNSNKGFCSF